MKGMCSQKQVYMKGMWPHIKVGHICVKEGFPIRGVHIWRGLSSESSGNRWKQLWKFDPCLWRASLVACGPLCTLGWWVQWTQPGSCYLLQSKSSSSRQRLGFKWWSGDCFCFWDRKCHKWHRLVGRRSVCISDGSSIGFLTWLYVIVISIYFVLRKNVHLVRPFRKRDRYFSNCT